jgi:hypothetical protein
MNDRSSFVGDWDLYSGPMHTELHLDGDGTYVHTLWGAVRKHWGNWSLENQFGVTFLVLRLVDAYPRNEAGPFGWQPVPWPSVEAWGVARNDGVTVMLAGAWMTRKGAVTNAVPTYVPPADLAAALPPPAYPANAVLPPAPIRAAGQVSVSPATPQPAQSQNSLPIFTRPPAVAQSPSTPPTVLAQWGKEQVGWDSVRNVAAATLDQDKTAKQSLEQMYAAEGERERAAKAALADKMTDFIRENNDKFTSMIRPSPTTITTFHYRR